MENAAAKAVVVREVVRMVEVGEVKVPEARAVAKETVEEVRVEAREEAMVGVMVVD